MFIRPCLGLGEYNGYNNHFEKMSSSVGPKSLAVFVGSEISSKGNRPWVPDPYKIGF